jgi:hypothetical protein
LNARRALALRAGAIILAALTVACGGDDDNATPAAGTPVGTKQQTAAPTETEPGNGGGATAPDPVDPVLDEQLTEVARDTLTATIDPGGTYDIDPEALAAASCDNFQFDFSWQVADPYPPDGVALQWVLVRNGVVLSSAPNGEQAVGCDAVQAVNNGSTVITVALKYAIGTIP